MAAIATAADLDDLLPGVEAAVPGAVISKYLVLAAMGCNSFEAWGEDLATAQALRALHMLSRAQLLKRYKVTDPAEAGPLSARCQGGGNSSSYAGAAYEAGDIHLALTIWGRMYLDLWQSARPCVSGGLVG